MSKLTFDIAPIDSREIVRRIQKIEAAKQEVRSLVGDVALACDSVDGVYIAAMEHLGRDCADIEDHPNAAAAIWPSFKRHQQGGGADRPIGMDARAVRKRNEMFPHANRLRNDY